MGDVKHVMLGYVCADALEADTPFTTTTNTPPTQEREPLRVEGVPTRGSTWARVGRYIGQPDGSLMKSVLLAPWLELTPHTKHHEVQHDMCVQASSLMPATTDGQRDKEKKKGGGGIKNTLWIH